MPVSPYKSACVIVRTVLAGVALVLAGSPGRAQSPLQAPPAALCAPFIAAAERAHGLPPYLLHAMAMVESGRRDPASGASIAWPWTVTARGHGQFLPTKEAAIAAVKRLLAEGVKNIDVGCMQINLRHHPDAFANLDDAFDPEHNVAYAARLLARLREASGSWTRAVGDYHSQTPRLSGRYRLKVFKVRFAARKQDVQHAKTRVN